MPREEPRAAAFLADAELFRGPTDDDAAAVYDGVADRYDLSRASDIPEERLQGSVLELPFADDTFDVVVSAWVIETVPEPMRAVSEYLRVIKPDGHVLYTFCSLPRGWFSRAGSAWLRAAVHRGFAGDFLNREHALARLRPLAAAPVQPRPHDRGGTPEVLQRWEPVLPGAP